MKQLKNVKRKTNFGNSERVKKISEGFAPVPQQLPPMYPLGGAYRPPDPQLCFISGLSIPNSLKKFKSTLDVTQINNFKKNAKASITKIVMLECSSLFIFSPI